MAGPRFSSKSADATGSHGGTDAGGLGGFVSDIIGGQTEYTAGAGEFRDADRKRIDEDRALQQTARGESRQFTHYLREAAMGRGGPSVAQQQLAQSAGRAEQAIGARAASARGPNRALAMRDATLAQGQMRGEIAAAGAVQRAQEQMSREQMVAQQLQQQRMLDLQAQGMSLEEATAKLNAEMKAQEINAQIAMANAKRAGESGDDTMSAIGSLISSSDVRNKTMIEPADTAALRAASASEPEEGGGIMDMAGGAMSMMSDRRAKTLETENATLREALRAATGATESRGPAVDLRQAPGYAYRYKDPNAPGAAPGPQIGPMAQDLERTAARGAVIDTPRGKMVDGGRLALTTAAAVGEEQRRTDQQDERISGLEEARARKASPFNMPAPRYDRAALDDASRRSGIEPRAGGAR